MIRFECRVSRAGVQNGRVPYNYISAYPGGGLPGRGAGWNGMRGSCRVGARGATYPGGALGRIRVQGKSSQTIREPTR